MDRMMQLGIGALLNYWFPLCYGGVPMAIDFMVFCVVVVVVVLVELLSFLFDLLLRHFFWWRHLEY